MPQKRKTSGGTGVGDLSFITDISLRKKIENAIEMISLLYLMERDGSLSAGFAKEVRRMIILYSASIIEASLLYLYRKKKFSIIRLDYAHVHTLPPIYQLDVSSVFVLAKQIKKERDDREIMLDILLKFFVEEGIIKDPLRGKVDIARKVRNTFHLSKSRKGIQCSRRAANISSEAVFDTIVTIRSYLRKNP